MLGLVWQSRLVMVLYGKVGTGKVRAGKALYGSQGGLRNGAAMSGAVCWG